ncbi:MAG: cytochrome c3 family protein [bacterium]|nr:cytochrome c3 family protein [bacterium]
MRVIQRRPVGASAVAFALLVVGFTLTPACVDETGRESSIATAESCMKCHNGSIHDDYAGPGLENPHPFPGAAEILRCTACHGGNPDGLDAATSHVPPPPSIGDRDFQDRNAQAYFNKLTLTGIDKVPDYTVDGVTYTGLDYLQFLNPGDLRVTEAARGCGECHTDHSASMTRSPIGLSMGILSGGAFASGQLNQIPGHQGLFEDTAADIAFRAVNDPSHVHDPNAVGKIGQLIEAPVWASREDEGPDFLFDNDDFVVANLVNDVNADGTLKPNSRLAKIYQEQIMFTCGDCHAGSSGANNRYGDFRPSGCASCHMPYSLDGRSRSRDPNVPKDEPADPDDIDDPERAHVRAHRILSVKRTLPNGHEIEGIDDYTCAGCHQGSNRTVMQYWGIRLDQNQDVRRGFQYPANPDSFQTTRNDTRLFDPEVGNRTFNGRNHNQYLLFEDYDGDGRDDTPADVHYEAGMGCVDCHGGTDLHGEVKPGGGAIVSRMSHAVAIQCETCHGTADNYATTVAGTNYAGQTATVAVDEKGTPLRHIELDGNGNLWLTSKVTGNRHFIRQTRDVVVDSGKTNPLTNEPLYSAMGSFAMGRDDGLASTGIGPQQFGSGHSGFQHTDSMDCASCHSSWTNTCIGCHLEGEYNRGNNFSNITGERISFRERFAEFVYQSPVNFTLGVGPDNKVTNTAANTKVFFRYLDIEGNRTPVFAFSDRNANGANPAQNPTRPLPALGHNALMAHSIRGKVNPTNEGPRYCVSCHLTDTAIANHGTAYDTFRSQLRGNDFGNLDFDLLKTHIGRNPGNQLNSPWFVHMAAGLGTGLYLFDQDGAAQNPLDDNPNRYGGNGAPNTYFDPLDVKYDLDRIVDDVSGNANASSSVPMNQPILGPVLRDGPVNQNLTGPLGVTLANRLADPVTGIVLTTWIDADGNPNANATTIINN